MSPSISRKLRHQHLRTVKRTLWKFRPHVCFVCGGPLRTFEEASVEHIQPTSLGGTDHIDNIALSHRECNEHMGTATMIAAKVTP